MYIVSSLFYYYMYKTSKCVHTTKYIYMLKILILTQVQINFLKGVAFPLLKRLKDFKYICLF